jgi:hypothetical protein
MNDLFRIYNKISGEMECAEFKYIQELFLKGTRKQIKENYEVMESTNSRIDGGLILYEGDVIGGNTHIYGPIIGLVEKNIERNKWGIKTLDNRFAYLADLTKRKYGGNIWENLKYTQTYKQLPRRDTFSLFKTKEDLKEKEVQKKKSKDEIIFKEFYNIGFRNNYNFNKFRISIKVIFSMRNIEDRQMAINKIIELNDIDRAYWENGDESLAEKYNEIVFLKEMYKLREYKKEVKKRNKGK